ERWRLSETRGPTVASHVLVTMQPGEARQVSVTWDGRAWDGSLVTGPVEIRAEIDRVASPPRAVQIGPARTPARPTPRSLAPARPQGVAPVAAAKVGQAAEARRLALETSNRRGLP